MASINCVEVKNIGLAGCAGFTQWIVVKAVMKSKCIFDIANSRSKIKSIMLSRKLRRKASRDGWTSLAYFFQMFFMSLATFYLLFFRRALENWRNICLHLKQSTIHILSSVYLATCMEEFMPNYMVMGESRGPKRLYSNFFGKLLNFW